MSGKNYLQHTLESKFKSDFVKYCNDFYPLAHCVIIPATYWRLLPYDVYVLYNGIFRAIELKVDDNPVMAHQMKALCDVVANLGYAFSMRWMNVSRSIIIENFTLGTSEIIKPVISGRQITGDTRLDIEDKPWSRRDTYEKALKYIMGFQVSPLESEVQHIIKKNYQRLLAEVSKKK